MSYKCKECGHIFEENEAKCYRENQGECHGAIAYETFTVCPCCGDTDFEEIKPCKKCGGEHLEEELFDGVCFECLEANFNSELGIEYIINNGDCLEHFAFTVLMSINPPKDTNEKLRTLLTEYIKKVATFEQLKKYVFEDGFAISDFAEWLNSREVK